MSAEGDLKGYYYDASRSQGPMGFCPSCEYCQKIQELTRPNQDPSLENVRKLVIEFYPCIFHYQVWDRQSGLPLLQQVFLQNVQLNPFTYLCHCVYSEAGWAMKFSGKENAMSLCNIAIVSAVCHFLLEFKPYLDQLMERHCKPYLDQLMKELWKPHLDRLMEEYWISYLHQLTFEHRVAYVDPLRGEHRKSYVDHLMEEHQESSEEHRKSYVDQLMEDWKSKLGKLMEGLLKSYMHQLLEEHRKSYVDQLMEDLKSNLGKLMEEHLKSYMHQLMKEHLKSSMHQLMKEHLKSSMHQLMKEHRKSYMHQQMEEHLKSYMHHLMKEQRKSYMHQLMEEHLKSYMHQLMEEHLKSYMHQRMEEDLKSYMHQLMEGHLKSFMHQLMEEHLKSYVHQLMEGQLIPYMHQLMGEHRESYIHQLMEEYRKSYLGQLIEDLKTNLDQLMQGFLKTYLHQLVEEYWESGIKQSTKLQGFVSPLFFRGIRDDAFRSNLWRNIPEGFQNLLDCVNGEILTCVSPEMKWVIQAGDLLQVSKLRTGNKEKHHIRIEKPIRFTCSKDDVFFVHQSSGGSLQALSFKTGRVLSSVSGCNVGYFTRERQVGYLFRCGNEETAIFLTSLFSPFKFLPLSNATPLFVGKSVAAMFCSSDAVVSVSSDSMVTLMHNSKEVITEECIGRLTASSPQSLTVKNCALSSNGRLIAIHQESKIELYSFTESKLKFLYSKCESTITCFSFLSDSTTLLLCTHDSYFHVWDIQEDVVSARLESRVNLTPECCCLSSDKVVLCGDYEIEIWEYAEQTCCLITRLSVEKPYNCVRFSQCTLSVDNQFLVCCIADVILVYSLRTANIYSSKQVFRGHLGRIEVCRFLKINRYLISYGVDGMVFLWDMSQSKAVGFIRIAEGQESIVSMAVSPEEDRVVYFTSIGRVCMIKPCELSSALESKPVTAPVKVELQKTAETSLQPPDKADSWSSSDSEESYDFEDLDESD